MPTCKNGKGSYTGNEPSPKGNGFCARHEKIGTKKRGRDKKMWVVRSVKLATNKRSKRWFRVVKAKPIKKTKTPKSSKSSKSRQVKKSTKPMKRKRNVSKSTKPKTKKRRKRIRGIRGGQQSIEEKIKSLDLSNYSGFVRDRLERYLVKFERNQTDDAKIKKEILKSIETFTKYNLPDQVKAYETLRDLLLENEDDVPEPDYNIVIYLHTIRGKTYQVLCKLSDKVYDTLVKYEIENDQEHVTKIIGDAGQILYNSKNKNLTWQQMQNKSRYPFNELDRLHVLLKKK